MSAGASMSGDRAERARGVWAASDRLRNKARVMRDEADALARAAERLNRMAAAIADGRDDDLTEEALSVRAPGRA